MFTGLIQTLGVISSQGSNLFKIAVSGNHSAIVLTDLTIGDSVAVDGVCLTVETILADGFVATASPETLARTTLGTRLEAASYVNLETSLRVGSKIGGHFVAGHVDEIGCLIESVSTQRAWEMTFGQPSNSSEWQSRIARYLVTKGSIAVNGISLTVADCAEDGSWFKAAVIPHTYTETNLCYLQPGDFVNLESDILGKYVDKLIGFRLPAQNQAENISLSFLAENGYL